MTISPIALSLDLRNARGQAIVDKLDSGSGPGKFLIYTAPRPASGVAITTQVLLGTCVLSDPCGTVASGVTTFAPISDDVSVDATGTVEWVRGVNSDDAWAIDMSAGISGSGATLIFNTLSAQEGGSLQIVSGSLTEGNA